MDEKILEKMSQQLDMVLTVLMKSQEKPSTTSGRPTKEHIVKAYRERYPNATKRHCERATKLSRKTVNKYWNQADTKQEGIEQEDMELVKEVGE